MADFIFNLFLKRTITKNKIFLLGLAVSQCFLACKKEPVEDSSKYQLNPNLNYGELMDIDGNKYATITIGNQTWMAENLRSSRYSNGDSIPNIQKHAEWNNYKSGAWVHYNNNSSFDLMHGKLYNWYAISNPNKICPDGWRVPSNQDWTILFDYLGGIEFAGHKLKSNLKAAWAIEYNGQKTTVKTSNQSGFSAMASGYRGLNVDFVLLTYRSSFWSINEYNEADAFHSEIFWNGDEIGWYNTYKSDGLSCRCIKD